MNYSQTLDMIMDEISNVLGTLSDKELDNTCKMINGSRKVFVVGVGRVLLSLQAFTKRLNHLGIETYFVGEINEPHFTKDDLLIVGSGSGETLFPKVIAQKAKTEGGKILYIGSNANSTVAQLCDYMIRIPTRTKLNLKDEVPSNQIMTSLFEQSLLILGDIISYKILEDKGINIEDLWQYHANLE